MTLEEAVKNHSDDRGYYPDVFPIDCGLDLRLSDRPDLIPYDRGDKRCVRIIIRSFVGICWEAQHYYADIQADGCTLVYKREDNDSIVSVGGYISEEYKKKVRGNPLYSSTYDIVVQRLSTMKDVEEEPEDFYADCVGEQKTGRFYTKEDALNTAKEVVALRFPGWNVEIIDHT